MKHTALLVISGSLLLTYACGQTDPKGETAPPPEGLGGGDGDYTVESPAGGSEVDGDGDAVAPPLESCVLDGMETVGDPASGLLFDDFDDGDAAINGNGKTGDWYHYDDGTSTHTPRFDEPTGWLPEPGGISPSGYALHAQGSGFSTWGAGQGATPAWDPERQVNCLYDASAFDGVSFWIRGSITVDVPLAVAADQGVLKFGVAEPDIVPVEEGGNCTGDAGPCWDWHKTRITLSECWHRYSFRFDELTQDGWGAADEELEMDEFINFNFEVAQGHTFEFWLDEVMFFVGDTPPEEEDCDLGMGGGGGAGGGGS